MRKRFLTYVDTSVFGGTEDQEFREQSRRFFELVRKGRFLALISKEVADEIAKAPQAVQDVLFGLPGECLRAVEITDEVQRLAQAYISSGALTAKSKGDAIHVAAATVVGADLIVSWNFKHIVNHNRIRIFNGVNGIEGYKDIDIRSPLEVIYDDEA